MPTGGKSSTTWSNRLTSDIDWKVARDCVNRQLRGFAVVFPNTVSGWSNHCNCQFHGQYRSHRKQTLGDGSPPPSRRRLTTTTKVGCPWRIKLYSVIDRYEKENAVILPGIYIIDYGDDDHNHALQVSILTPMVDAELLVPENGIAVESENQFWEFASQLFETGLEQGRLFEAMIANIGL